MKPKTIASILDTDLYYLTQQAAILRKYPAVEVEYQFNNRRPGDLFNPQFYDFLRAEINAARNLALTPEEGAFLKSSAPFLPPDYLGWLNGFRFNPSLVHTDLVNGQLKLSIKGLWHETILWQALLQTISEGYFHTVFTDWNYDGQAERIAAKADILASGGCLYADFGSRRRRSLRSQEIVVSTMKGKPGFVGTSNVYLAMKYGLRPLGTMAHEWIMAHMVLNSLRHCNRDALWAWNDVYKGDLGVALTDTIGTDAFYADFDKQLARMFDGVRHDSGDPFVFVDKTVAHYKSLRLDPMQKTALFSDGLDPQTAVKIAAYCKDKIKCSFGIGTNFTNDYPSGKALNIVIKLQKVMGVPVVKLSDVPTKALGDRDALRVAKWIVFGTPLDAQ